ncbi:hypothetical protein RCL1_005026 [Eukaryota sp. TZLM3-RCL]
MRCNRFLIVFGSVTNVSKCSIMVTVQEFTMTESSLLMSQPNCLNSPLQAAFSPSDFAVGNSAFAHLSIGIGQHSSQDVILIAFEFSSSNLNNQYDQLPLKVFSLLNLHESNTFEFIIENDLMSLNFNEFSLEQDQSIIANITITHNSNQCTTEFPHEVQFNSIVSCSFCISNTGYTNTSSLQVIDESIELQTDIKGFCSFLKELIPLFLIVSDYKLVIRDQLRQQTLIVSSPKIEVTSIDHVSSSSDTSVFIMLTCKVTFCRVRIIQTLFNLTELKPDNILRFLGCFRDGSPRTMPLLLGVMTYDQAIATGNQQGFKYIGLQWAHGYNFQRAEVWATNSETYNRFGTTTCVKLTTGQLSGGSSANAVYQLRDHK